MPVVIGFIGISKPAKLESVLTGRGNKKTDREPEMRQKFVLDIFLLSFISIPLFVTCDMYIFLRFNLILFSTRWFQRMVSMVTM